MTDWQRLEQLIKWTGLSTNAFSVGIGLKRAENLYQIKRGNNGISKDLAELIARKYPSVNRAWLLMGDGDLFLDSVADTPSDRLVNSNSKQRNATLTGGIPYYNTDAVGLVCEQQRPEPECYINLPGFGDCDFAATCTGNTMSPEIPSGATVLLKEMDVQTPLLLNEIYIVVTSDFAVLRYVGANSQTPGELMLRSSPSLNETEIKVARSRIERLYLIKGIIIQKVL